jgi:hypothetical protein
VAKRTKAGNTNAAAGEREREKERKKEREIKMIAQPKLTSLGNSALLREVRQIQI